jgi:hypothetical protein
VNGNQPHFDNAFIQGLYDWQSLVGAGLALLAALLGAVLLWRQIQSTERHEAERRRRRFAAARATLPMILDEIISYLELAMAWMTDTHAKLKANPPGQIGEVPQFPASVIGSLEKMIEASSVDGVAQACAEILSDLQTLRARMQSVPRASASRVGLESELEGYMLQSAELHYRVGLLFPFARGRSDDVVDHIKGMSVYGGLVCLKCEEASFPDVYKRANEIDRKRLQTMPKVV